jgi:hypothetical protein
MKTKTSSTSYKNKAHNLLKLLGIRVLLLSHIAHADFSWDLIKKPEFKKAYLKVLGDKRKENWIATLSGPSSEVEQTTIDGNDFIIGHSCRPHYCNTHNLFFFYSPNDKQVFVKLAENGKFSILGKPTPKVEEELNAHYNEYFNKKPLRSNN